jgi:predicted metalloprotease with PDZ domain
VKALALALVLTVTPIATRADNAVAYEFRYSGSAAGAATITISLPESIAAPAPLVMPRSYPGGYGQIPYDSFVTGVAAFAPDGRPLRVEKEADGPRWSLGQSGDVVGKIEYRVDIAKMEMQIRDAVSTSKIRKGYLGVLGYSVFAFVDGLEDRRVALRVQAPASWPVLPTLNPTVPAPKTTATATAMDYYALADSEILMGPDLRVTKIEGNIPLIMAIYAEGTVDLGLEGRLARAALNDVQAYFGDTPIRRYTVQLELLRPLPGHDYGFSQEHADSGTFTRSVEGAIGPESTPEVLRSNQFDFAHHMAHSWIPKLAYGSGYRPFTWEMTPVIDTIWFNEGFGRYAAIAATAAGMPPAEGREFRDRQLAAMRKRVATAEPFIRRMSLSMLSREASFLYADDFRTGHNVFSRGALMAAEMDDRIRAETLGKKSLRDGLQWLLQWSAEHRKAFETEDFSRYIAAGTGVDVDDIMRRWMKPLEL